jgi:hypothetical protein
MLVHVLAGDSQVALYTFFFFVCCLSFIPFCNHCSVFPPQPHFHAECIPQYLHIQHIITLLLQRLCLPQQFLLSSCSRVICTFQLSEWLSYFIFHIHEVLVQVSGYRPDTLFEVRKILLSSCRYKSWDSSFDIVMGYRVDGWVTGFSSWEIFFLSLYSSGACQTSYDMCIRGSFPGVKWLGCETNHLHPSSAEVKNAGAIPPFSIHLHGRVLN